MTSQRDHYTIKLPILDPRSASKATTKWFVQRDFDGLDTFPRELIPVQFDSALNLRRAAYRLACYFQREFRYDFLQYSVDETKSKDTTFLWSPNVDIGGPAWGAVCFRWRNWEDQPPGWALAWIWLHPFERARGHLKKAWPFFRAVYGEFHVEAPLSPAMEAFLKSTAR